MTVYGVIAHVLDDIGGFEQLPAGANAAVVLNRVRISDDGRDHEKSSAAVRVDHLAAVARLSREVSPVLLAGVHRRRAAAAASTVGGDAASLSLAIRPRWRVVIGHGGDSALETGLSMSPTYGVPILPASALKGITAAYARSVGVDDDAQCRLFGSPRPDVPATAAGKGSVTWLDGIPTEQPQLVVDVLTPHVKPYYDKANSTGAPTTPPAEYHNPVPIRFLALAGTPLRTLLLGPRDDVEQAADLMAEALDDIGIGGKTAAGYGYCTTTQEQ